MRGARLAYVRNVVWACRPGRRSTSSSRSYALPLPRPAHGTRACHVPRHVSGPGQDRRSAEEPRRTRARPEGANGPATAPVLRAHGPLARPCCRSSAASIPTLCRRRLRRSSPLPAPARGVGVVPAECRPSTVARPFQHTLGDSRSAGLATSPPSRFASPYPLLQEKELVDERDQPPAHALPVGGVLVVDGRQQSLLDTQLAGPQNREDDRQGER